MPVDDRPSVGGGGRLARTLGSLALGLTLAAPAGAVPAVAGIGARRPASVHPDAAQAFLAGAAEAAGALQPVGPATLAQQATAVQALGEGEAAYLELKLKVAETRLNDAVEGLLASPTELVDAEPAVRGSLLLAQVLVARRQPDAADLVLERALLTLPGFPRGGQPPPDIQARIEKVRSRLGGRLKATLVVESEPPGAEIRVNGVEVGPAPVRLERLAPGPVRVTSLRSGRSVAKRVVLADGVARVRLAEGAGRHPAVVEALVAGDEAGTYRAAAAAQREEGADAVCAGLVVGSDAWILRIDGAGRRVVAAHREPAPAAEADWSRLGRHCDAELQGDVPAEAIAELWQEQAVVDAVRPPVVDPVEPGGDTGLALATLAGGAVAAGVGTWLGLSASDAADRYNRSGASQDEDAARRDALLADISFTAAVGLVVTGVYLLVAD
ncbi:MAG: PEGA domain-containing protein [bacterium]